MKKLNYISTLFALPFAAMVPVTAVAQLVVSDTLTGATSTYPWKVLGDACLTAGTAATTTTGPGGNSYIPACSNSPITQVGGVAGVLPDPVGKGALRLTNGGGATGRNGAVVSTIPFPTNEGVQVTFSTVTYGGNGYGNANGIASGADGLAFFFLDGANKNPTIGAYGGSLGYSCSQGKNPPDGVIGGYLAVAADEYGNFSNRGDATADGNSANPGTIVVRGAGSISFAALNAAYPNYYPSNTADKLLATQNTCATGFLQNWSGGKVVDANGKKINDQSSTTETVYDYKMLTTPVLVNGNIYNQENVAKPLRSAANVITYDLSITQNNLLSLAYSYNGGATTPVISSQSITAGNGPLPSSFLFGFTSGTGGGTNVHEITCFKAAPIDSAANSAGANVQQSAQVRVGSQVYLSFYHPLNSWGQLTASNLNADPQGNVTIASIANWDASCILTGGACSTTGKTVTAQGSAGRTILSWNGTSGIPFQYNSLASFENTALGGSTDGATRLAYLRGDRSNERNTSGVGPFRRRDGLLGDIVNSSPTWVGNPVLPYATGSKDLLKGTTIAEFGTSYATYASSNLSRTHVVYSGANDGMLHGFRAGGFDSAGAFVSTQNDGKEVISYVPQTVVRSIHPSQSTLDFSSPQYGHNAYVDATPGTGDLFYKGAWHTWLVSGIGAGGNPTGVVNDKTSTALGTLFALDITDPSKFSESSAASLVINEWNSTNITCVNDPNCKDSMGSQYGTPVIRLMHDGNWAVIFGNGRNSVTGTAGVFIMSIDRATGATSIRFLDTGSKDTTNRNGIDYVGTGDLDGDHVTDYLYAGDSAGNLWRFDVTSSKPSNWAVDAKPMFTTPGGQPITTRPTVTAVAQKSGASRILIGVGTGRQSPQTLTSATTYAAGTQSVYGIWDSRMTAWNAISTTQYASLPSTAVVTDNDLQIQTATTFNNGPGSISSYRTVTQNPVCWQGSTNCKSLNNKYGWKLNLPQSSEQIIYNPTAAFGTMIVNTTIPSVSQSLSCNAQPASGFTMAISVENGGAPIVSLFNDAAKTANISSTGIIAGLGLSATGTPSIVSALGKQFMVQQTVSSKPEVTQLTPPPNGLGKRLTWVKLR